MRLELLWNLRLLCERLAVESIQRRRIGKLRNTPASGLSLGHIDSLELLELARDLGIRVIYDVGANVGTWVLLAKSVIPEATVEAFEPLRSHHEGFVRNCDALSGVSLHPIALGSEEGEAAMHVTNYSDASSLLSLSERGRLDYKLNEERIEMVPLFRLDDYVASQNLAPPDLIKLDVQGYEQAVLEGSTHTLKHVKAVIAEVSLVEFYEQQCLFDDVVGFMASEGFHLRAFSSVTTTGRFFGQTDVMFVRVGLA